MKESRQINGKGGREGEKRKVREAEYERKKERKKERERKN
jgi:hypothetical protein